MRVLVKQPMDLPESANYFNEDDNEFTGSWRNFLQSISIKVDFGRKLVNLLLHTVRSLKKDSRYIFLSLHLDNEVQAE